MLYYEGTARHSKLLSSRLLESLRRQSAIVEFNSLTPLRGRPCGNLEIQESGNPGIQKTKYIKIRIRSVKNVGTVWIGRENKIPTLFRTISSNLIHRPEKYGKYVFYLFSLVVQWLLFTQSRPREGLEPMEMQLAKY